MGACSSLGSWHPRKEAWLHFAALGNPLPKATSLCPDREKSVNDQLADWVVGSLVPGTRSLGGHLGGMRLV